MASPHFICIHKGIRAKSISLLILYQNRQQWRIGNIADEACIYCFVETSYMSSDVSYQVHTKSQMLLYYCCCYQCHWTIWDRIKETNIFLSQNAYKCLQSYMKQTWIYARHLQKKKKKKVSCISWLFFITALSMCMVTFAFAFVDTLVNILSSYEYEKVDLLEGAFAWELVTCTCSL